LEALREMCVAFVRFLTSGGDLCLDLLNRKSAHLLLCPGDHWITHTDFGFSTLFRS